MEDSHWSWEGRDEREQLAWERDLLREVADARTEVMKAARERARRAESEIMDWQRATGRRAP